VLRSHKQAPAACWDLKHHPPHFNPAEHPVRIDMPGVLRIGFAILEVLACCPGLAFETGTVSAAVI
jgi:hypothetical protein